MTQPESKAVAKAATENQAEKGSVERELMAVATTFEEKQQAFTLATAYRQSQMVAKASEAVAELSWGQKLSPVARAAVARYALAMGTDPMRHWEVLGGRMYDRAELWYDVCAAHPDFAGADDPILVHADPRADKDEAAKRAALRLAWGVPEETPGAALVTLHTKTRGDFRGCNWVKVGTYKESGKPKDPVGLEHPTQTAITRAWRKAAKKAFPLWFLQHPLLERAEQLIVDGREQPKGEAAVPAVVTDGGLEPEPPKQLTSEAKKPLTVKHEPSAICDESDWHPRAECGYERTPGREPGQEGT